jgi:integrase
MTDGPPKRTRQGSPFRSETEVGELFERLRREHLSGWEDGRLYALMLLVCTTGIRGPAALRLRVADFDFEAGTISAAAIRRAKIKGHGRAAEVKLMGFSIPPLGEWSRRCGSDFMFPGKRKSCTWAHASANKQLDAVCVELGMAGGTTIEIVRHSIILNTLSFRMGDAEPGGRRDLRIFAEPSE